MHLVFKNRVEDENSYASNLEIVAKEGASDRDHPFWTVDRRIKQGEILSEFPETTFMADRKPPDLLAFGGHYVVSGRVRRVMESFNAEVEYYPVEIRQADAPDNIHESFLLGFQQSVDCIDLEKSDGTWVQDKLKGEKVDRLKDPTKLVLKPEALEGIQICKVDRKHFRHVLEIISLELACALHAEELTGMWFFTTEEYRYPDYVKISTGGMEKKPLDCSMLER